MKLKVAGVPVHLVDIDMNREDLVVRPVVTPTGHRYDFDTITSRHRPVAAVNGTFFDTRTGITIGNLVSEGRMLSEGMMGSSLVFNRDGSVALLSSSRNLGRYKDWAEVDFAIGGGITLLSHGSFFMDPAAEGFSDPSLFKPRPRTAVGVTSEGKLRMVVATQSITLWQMAHIMERLKCVHAINLDGGSSTALAVGGTTMVKPSRKLTNIIGVFPKYLRPAQSRAVQVAWERANGHYQKGLQLKQQGRLREARSQLRQAVSKAPGQAGFWKAAGLVEVDYGDRRRGVKDLHRSAELYIAQQKHSAALDVLRTLTEIDEADFTACLKAAQCMVALGSDDEAEEYALRVLKSLPGHPEASKLVYEIQLRRSDFH